jgi:hypothetical protein
MTGEDHPSLADATRTRTRTRTASAPARLIA